MRRSPALIAFCLVFAGCSGCQHTSELRVISPGYLSDAVALWVSNQSMHSEDRRPRIVSASVSFDGVTSEVEPKIDVFNSKYGWTEQATFSAPETAKTAQIEAIVESGGKSFAVTQDWSQRSTSAGRDWIHGPSSITEQEQERKGK